MAFEHRGFRVDVDVVPDDTGTQWICRANIDSIVEQTRKAAIPAVELTIPKTKIDILMAISMIEHRAKTSIDDWHDREITAA